MKKTKRKRKNTVKLGKKKNVRVCLCVEGSESQKTTLTVGRNPVKLGKKKTHQRRPWNRWRWLVKNSVKLGKTSETIDRKEEIQQTQYIAITGLIFNLQPKYLAKKSESSMAMATQKLGKTR